MKVVYPCKDKIFLLHGSNLILTFDFFAVCHSSLAQSLMSYCESLRNYETFWSFRKTTSDLYEKGIFESTNCWGFFPFGNGLLGFFLSPTECGLRGRDLKELGQSCPSQTLQWYLFAPLSCSEMSLYFTVHELCSWLPFPSCSLPKVSGLCPLGALHCFNLDLSVV